MFMCDCKRFTFASKRFADLLKKIVLVGVFVHCTTLVHIVRAMPLYDIPYYI